MQQVRSWVRELAAGRTVGPAAARVLEIIEVDPRHASYASTAELAERADVNVATVVRLAQQLGFRGWPALRLELRNRYLASLSANQLLTEHEAVDSPAAEAVRRDIAGLESLARSIDPAQIARVAQLIAGARRTLVVGSGSFAAPGLQLAHLGQTMGHDVRLQTQGGTALINELRRLAAGDCLVVFNLWWLPRQIFDAARVASGRGAHVVVVTDRRGFADIATEVVVVPSEGVSLFPSLTPAISVTHGVLAELARIDEPATRRAVAEAEALWREFDLFERP
ncbi:MurR/RpiR family transcriptional regulator [Pseudonocardia nigra]|uniref:MurR/RpiR family transcriptional regulator n=1 Tax=Pseudonocardia nigra TaxID=1921578 RepID=UPI001C6072A6|nr:MurR/RpiR family transcriptional regulator [Pseudonocardia nigra]